MTMTRYCLAGDGAFEDWVKTCPECGRTLSDDAPSADLTRMDPSEIVWLVNAPNEPEALMWADTIRSEGIPVLIRPGGPGMGAWASVSSFEHGLFVRERDLGRARKIAASVLGTSRTGGRSIPRRTANPRTRAVRKTRRPS